VPPIALKSFAISLGTKYGMKLANGVGTTFAHLEMIMRNFNLDFCVRHAGGQHESSSIFPLIGVVIILASATAGYGALYYFFSTI
jgi:hypothetical protein